MLWENTKRSKLVLALKEKKNIPFKFCNAESPKDGRTMGRKFLPFEGYQKTGRSGIRK